MEPKLLMDQERKLVMTALMVILALLQLAIIVALMEQLPLLGLVIAVLVDMLMLVVNVYKLAPSATPMPSLEFLPLQQ